MAGKDVGATESEDRTSDRLLAIDAEAQRVWAARVLGSKIGPFHIVEQIGSDEIGASFKAVDVEKDRIVRLEVLWFKIASDETDFARFVRAMRTTIDLEHPNVVRLLAAGRDGELCYLVTEYEKVRSVAEAVAQAEGGRLSWPVVLGIARDITRALELAFEKKILHRNIHPGSIVLAPDGTAKLDHLILAKAIEGARVEKITNKDSGQIIGQMLYLSPEALVNDERMDCRSDIYSLGTTLYHALAGQPPFQSRSIPDLANQIRHQPPRPLAEFQSIPPQFAAVVLRMLAKRPEDRFETPAELAAALDAIPRST